MKHVLIAIYVWLSLAAFGQQAPTQDSPVPLPTMEQAMESLVRDAKYLSVNLSTMAGLRGYADVLRKMNSDAYSTQSSEPYQLLLRECLKLQKLSNGRYVFRSPHDLSERAKNLNATWERKPFMGQELYKSTIRSRFSEVQEAYSGTLTLTYTWIEYVRRQYVYGENKTDAFYRTESFLNLRRYLQKLHEQAQTILGAMDRLRRDADLATVSPNFESKYARIFHAGLPIEWERKTPMNLTPYFAPYFSPLFEPNKSDLASIALLMERHPELRDASKLRSLLERLVRETQQTQTPQKEEAKSPEGTGSRPGVTEQPPPTPEKKESIPEEPSEEKPDEKPPFKEEPPYVKDNKSLIREILRMQIQVERSDLAIDDELKENLNALKTEIGKHTEDYPYLSGVIQSIDKLLSTTEELTAEQIRERLKEILTGQQGGLRPGYSNLLPSSADDQSQ